jgi:hypothetical protein
MIFTMRAYNYEIMFLAKKLRIYQRIFEFTLL